MDETLNAFLRQMGSYSVILPMLIGGIFYNRVAKDRRKLLLLSFVIFSAVIEFLALRSGSLGLNNLYLLHFYTLVEYVILVSIFCIYSSLGIHVNKAKWWIAVFVFLGTMNAFFIEGINSFNANIRALESLILMGFALYFFMYAVKGMIQDRIERNPSFWISTAVLIYFSGNLISFILSNYALVSPEMSHTIWGLHALLNVLKNILFAIALWVTPEVMKSPSI